MSGKAVNGVKEKPLSRLGRKPIPIPPGVKVQIENFVATVQGPKGTLTQPLHPEVVAKVVDGTVVVERTSAKKFQHALHGLTRSLIANSITGVTQGYTRSLELMAVGYRVQQSGPGIVLNVGLSHQVEIKPPQGITLTVEGNNRIHVQGCNKQQVGQMAAEIRKVRPPNPYKEKGIKYSDEIIHLKPGKTAARKV